MCRKYKVTCFKPGDVCSNHNVSSPFFRTTETNRSQHGLAPVPGFLHVHGYATNIPPPNYVAVMVMKAVYKLYDERSNRKARFSLGDYLTLTPGFTIQECKAV